MPRIRTIKPEFPDYESIGRCSRDARLLLLLLNTQADDEGRLRGNHRYLAHKLFPYDTDAEGKIGGWLAELEAADEIQAYPFERDTYVSLTNWARDQKIDHPNASRRPSPPRLGQADLFELEADENASTDQSSEIAQARRRHRDSS
jgi:hypothetical protein